jgi:ABC-2 type transport system permease protein
MPLKTLSFNQGVLRQNIRSLSWIGIIYFLILLFILPLQFILSYDSQNQYRNYYEQNLFAIMDPIQAFLMFIVPVLLAMVLFRYLHMKGSADFYHSLPVKREELFLQNVLYGMFILIVPVLLTGILLISFYDVIHVFPTISVGEIWNWMGITILFNLFVFFISVFVAMITGITAIHAVITYVFFVLPFGVFSLSVFNIQYFLFGFSTDYYLKSNIERLVPFVRAAELQRMPLTGKEALVYGMITIVFSILALVVYKYRKIESAQQPIAFQKLQPIFKYGVATCCLLIGGFYFGESKNQLEWVLFGMVSASLIGFFIAEMVLAKTWRIFNKWKGYVFFLTSFAVIGLLFHFVGSKFEQKLPNLADVERVYIGDFVMFLNEDLSGNMYEFDSNYNFFLKDKKNVEAVYKFHKDIINSREQLEGASYQNTRSVSIGYELKNDKMLIREYQVPIDLYNDYFEEIAITDEYKYNHYPLLRFKNVNEIKRIGFHPNEFIHNPIVITDPAKMVELVTILQEEMKNESADSILTSQASWATLELFVSNKQQYHVEWKKSYTKVDEWLKENGLQQNARLTAEGISKIIIAEKDADIYTEEKMLSQEDMIHELEKKENTLVITDPFQIEESLRKAFWYEEGSYLVGIYFKDEKHGPIMQSFSEDSLPEFVRDYFK